MKIPLESKVRSLAAVWRERADALDREASEAASDLGLGPGEPEPSPIAALRREASTYRAGGLELDQLVPPTPQRVSAAAMDLAYAQAET